MQLLFYIQGSSSKPYRVTFEGEGQSLVAFCSCPAGRRGGKFCKHIASLLKGDVSKVVDPSDDIASLMSKSSGSPLLEKAEAHTPARYQNIKPLENIGSIKDVSGLIQPLLFDTGLWSEYSASEDSSEFLTVFMRKMYKNGKPYKNPTILLSISYQPIIYELVWDEDSDGEMQEKATGKRTLPYLVDSTNYGKIGTAGASFMKKLEDILKAHS